MSFTFAYSVQVSHDGRHWTTVAKLIDQHKADVLAFGLHEEGRDHVRVRRGTSIISTFPLRGEPKLHR